MVFDFMQEIMSRLDSLDKKVDGNQQCFEKLSKRLKRERYVLNTCFFMLHYNCL